jgi:hypothetical protein
MRRSFLALAMSIAVLLFGGAPIVAQQGPGGPMMQGDQQEMQQRREMMQRRQQQQQQQHAPDTEDQDSAQFDPDRGMMGRGYGRGWMHDSRRGARQGRMRDSAWGPGGMMGTGMMGPGMMRMMFILMDADGDGSLSLEEFQAAHERIFKAMDANKDGRVTPEEMRAFRMNLPAQQP